MFKKRRYEKPIMITAPLARSLELIGNKPTAEAYQQGARFKFALFR